MLIWALFLNLRIIVEKQEECSAKSWNEVEH